MVSSEPVYWLGTNSHLNSKAVKPKKEQPREAALFVTIYLINQLHLTCV